MKKKLLFTAVVVAAMSGTMVPVLALQNPAETEAGFMANEAGDVETSDDYTDVTNDFVVNATCSVDGGWQRDSRNSGQFFIVNDPTLYSDVYAGQGVESWVSEKAPLKDCNLIYQNIANLPNGTYRLTACAMGRNQIIPKTDDNNICGAGLYLFANDAQTQVTSDVWNKYSTTVEVTNGTLCIGLRAGGDNVNNWVAISQVVLEYQGDALLGYFQNELREKVDYAHELGSQYEANGDVPTQYSDELKNYQAATCTEVSQIQAEIEKIDEKITSIVNDIKNLFYVVYKSTEDYVNKVLIDALEADESAKETLRATITSAKAKALASIDMAVWKEANMELEQACKAYYEASSGIKSEIVNFDLTRLVVKNAGFEEENPLDGWDGLNEADIYTDGTYHMVRKGGRNWRVLQTVEVPNGLYSMSVQIGFAQSDRNQIFLESSYQRATTLFKWTGAATDEEILASWSKDNEAQRSSVGNVLVIDGKITMGVEWIKDSETMKFDNFRLVRLNDGENEIKALYEQKKAEADAIDQNILFDAFKQRLVSALAMPVTTIDEYYAAYNELNKVVADCSSAEGAIMTLVDLIDECQYYYDNSQTTVEIKENFLNAINEAKTYQQLTSSEILQEYADNLELARQTFVEHANPINEVQFDMTYLIKNPDVTGKPKGPVSSFGWVSSTNSWSNNFNNNGDPSQFYESYQNGAFGAGTWVLYQPIHLIAGSYKMTLKAFGMNANGAGSGPLVASVYAGETKGESIIDGNTLNNTFGVNFKVLADSEMNLGVKIDEGNGANWVGANDMKLYKLAPEDMTLNETATTYDVEEDMYTNVIVNRTLKADDKWNTFCVPFAMSAEQLADNHIAEVRKLESVETVGESFVLNFSEPVTEIEAGVPYIVKVDEAVNQIIVNGVVVKAADPMALTVGGVVMQGIYGSMTITGDHYFISDNKFYRAADKTVKVNGFRAYISLSGAQVAGINKMFINVDGEVTEINEAVEDLSDELVNVYTLNGVCVKSGVKMSEALNCLRKGPYIVNGKKVIK